VDAHNDSPPTPGPPPPPVCSRIVCGIDGSAEGVGAVAESARLVPEDGHLLLVAAILPGIADSVISALRPPQLSAEDELHGQARAALEDARAAVGTEAVVSTVLRTGPPAPILEAEVAEFGADTLAVGSHGRGRAAGVVLGSVATRLIHHAACSVLVSRSSAGADPRVILVGVDGSEGSLRALRAGQQLSDRMGGRLRAVQIGADGPPAGGLPGEIEVLHDAGKPAHVLIAQTPADGLLVVGSRGLRGIKALGSVSEVVAHRAACSVLIVR